MRPQLGLSWAACALVLITAGCSAKGPVAIVRPPTPKPVVTPAPFPAIPVRDQVAELLATSNRHFDTAQRALQSGHLDSAKAEFRRALDVLSEAPPGVRTELRVREYRDRLVERIRVAEATALATQDAADQQKQEPAPLERLLEITGTGQPTPPTAATTTAVADDLDEPGHDIEIPLNDKVLSYVELFSSRLRGYLEDGLDRGTRYLPMIQDVFKAEGLPMDLAYVPLIESAFKPNAVSKAKAKGMWQFMHGTALEVGLKHDWYIDERSDPEKATRAAAKYLKMLYGMFGDWHLALAAYNGGPGRVQRAMKASKEEDFWSLTDTTQYLPRETREYVPLILAAVVVARNPEQYGLELAPLDLDPVERVVLDTAVDLRKVAEWMEMPVQGLQQLNPELRRWTTPLRANDYALNVPEGMADLVRQRISESDPEDLAAFTRHTVKSSETLVSIARKLGVTRADLAEANYLPTNARLQAGQKLVVPRPPSLQLAGRASDANDEDDVVRAAPVARADAPAKASAAPRTAVASNTTPAKLTHRVKSGETLFSIAQLYRTTVASIKQLNAISGTTIRSGQRLTVRAAGALGTN